MTIPVNIKRITYSSSKPVRMNGDEISRGMFIDFSPLEDLNLIGGGEEMMNRKSELVRIFKKDRSKIIVIGAHDVRIGRSGLEFYPRTLTCSQMMPRERIDFTSGLKEGKITKPHSRKKLEQNHYTNDDDSGVNASKANDSFAKAKKKRKKRRK